MEINKNSAAPGGTTTTSPVPFPCQNPDYISINMNIPPPYYSVQQADPNRINNGAGTSEGHWIIRRPASTTSRLILDFYVDPLTGQSQVLAQSILERIPPVLAEKGITQEEWVEWMARFKKEVRQQTPSIVIVFFLTLFAVLTIIGIPCMLYMSKLRQRKMRNFNEEINRQLFEPRGMYWKTQRSWFSSDEHTESIHWIAISLDQDDAQTLKNEEHILFFDRWTSTHRPRAQRIRMEEFCCHCSETLQY